MDNIVDLRALLESWPYDPEQNVRRAKGADGREVLQVRLPLGIEQYEVNGRPDGERPYGKESVLEYHLERLGEAGRAGRAAEFHLDSEQCEELFAEGTLYYYRYLHLFQIKDWLGTMRDTARNLQVFDLVRDYAEDEDDKVYLEQWRPYLIRINAVAAAMLQIEQADYGGALEAVRAAIQKIDGLEELDDETFQFERERSLAALREIATQIEETKPRSQIEELELELKKAIAVQHFERAADLRDRIRALRDDSKTS
jgi:hypothetical protein